MGKNKTLPRRRAGSFAQDAQCKHIEKKCETFMMCMQEVGHRAAMQEGQLLFYSAKKKRIRINVYKLFLTSGMKGRGRGRG